MLYFTAGILIGITIIIFSLKKKENRQLKEISSSSYRTIIILQFIIFGFLLFYKIQEIPVPYHADEAGTVYDAVSIANYHVDRYLYHFPVYFVNFGGGGQGALYTYLAAFAVKLFGFSAFSVRLPSVIMELISSLVFTWLIYKEFGRTASAAGMAVFCFQPFSIMHSRWALGAFLLFPMVVISCAAFYQAIQSGKTKWFIICGFSFGITLYSYAISYLILPLFLGISILYLLYLNKITWKNIFSMGIPLFLLAVPLMITLAVNSGLIDEIRTGFISFPKIYNYRGGEITLQSAVVQLKFTELNIFHRIFISDLLVYNAVPKFGTINYVCLPFIAYGFGGGFRRNISSIKEKRFSFEFIMHVLFTCVFIIMLPSYYISINKTCAIYLPLFYFLVVGIYDLLLTDRRTLSVFLLTMMCSFLLFLNYYFTDFSKDIYSNGLVSSLADLKEALDFSDTVYKNDNEMIYVVGRSEPYISVLIALDVDPYSFNEKKTVSYENRVKIYDHYRFDLDAVMPECIYIFRDLNNIPENIDTFGFGSRQFGSVIVYYPAN